MNVEQNNLSFDDLCLNQSILKALKKMDFHKPTNIQSMVIPSLLESRDVIAQAQTGTGKTAAFGLPVLQLMSDNPKSRALIITPTRELARQVSQQLNRFGEFLGIKTTTVCGGESFSRQLEMIKQSRILVATPGRLLDLYRSNKLKQFNPSFVVLDEADEMLDMGFLEDIEQIFSYIPAKRQTLLFSATLSKSIKKLADKLLNDPFRVNLSPENSLNHQIDQTFYIVRDKEREDALIRLIDSQLSQKSLIFCSTKKDVDNLSSILADKGYPVKSLHGDMAQNHRKRALDAFRFGQCRILIATDVAARGIDVADISHVYNFEIPFSDESYIHRIGRTGRAGKKGVAITFVTPKEQWWLRKMSKINGKPSKIATIPTLEEVKKLKIKQMIDEIQKHPVDADAVKLFQDLNQEMDINAINACLISLLLQNEKITGPDRIGLSANELKSEPKQFPRNRKQKFNKWKPTRKKRAHKSSVKHSR